MGRRQLGRTPGRADKGFKETPVRPIAIVSGSHLWRQSQRLSRRLQGFLRLAQPLKRKCHRAHDKSATVWRYFKEYTRKNEQITQFRQNFVIRAEKRLDLHKAEFGIKGHVFANN